MFGNAIRGYFSVNVTNNDFVNEFFHNLDTAKQRDPSKGPNDAMASGDSTVYKQYLGWTWFGIPHDQLSSEDEEQEFIESTLEGAHNAFKEAVSTPVFEEVLRQQMSPGFFDICSKPQHGPNYIQYVQKAKTNIASCFNLNKHIVLDDTKRMKELLCHHELKKPKYADSSPPTPKKIKLETVDLSGSASSDESDSSESDDDSDGHKKPAAVESNKQESDDDSSSDSDNDETPIADLKNT